MRSELDELIGLDRDQTLVAHIQSVLSWDLETYMPPKAVDERAEQLALLEGLAHDRMASPRIGELLESLGSTTARPSGDPSLSALEGAYLRALRRAYDMATRLPGDHVTEFAKATALAQSAWAEARAAKDFPAFAPHLEKLVALSKARAAHLDPATPPYDVLLDLYEPGSTEAGIAGVFKTLRSDLVGLLGKISARPQVDDAFLSRTCPEANQAAISQWLMDVLGYDRERGRLDTTAHPFTTTLGADDVRITTRYLPHNLASSVFSTIHETGHALYELGIAPGEAFRRTKLSEAASMAVHESQSRLWENLVGRSEAFWRPHYAKLRTLAGACLQDIDLKAFIRGVNKVEPSLIRTEADEVTYGLHVILRFELEADLIAGRLAVKDVPAAWNAKMGDFLGVVPPDDASGCLQDVHWSCGYFGYFPSYALGNLYAAQLWDHLAATEPGVIEAIGRGETAPLKAWLGREVHRHGATFLPSELIQKVTGSPLDPRHFTAYLTGKYAAVYGF